jgi:hypothetical protein
MKGVSEGSIAKSSSGVDFTKTLCKAFMHADPIKCKKYSQAISLFCAFGICVGKSFKQNVGEIDPWSVISECFTPTKQDNYS